MSWYTHPIPDHSKCQWFHSQECRQLKVLVKDQEENRTEDWVTKAMEVKDEESSSSSSEDKRASKSKTTKALWPVLLSGWALLFALPMIWHNMWFSMFQSGKAIIDLDRLADMCMSAYIVYVRCHLHPKPAASPSKTGPLIDCGSHAGRSRTFRKAEGGILWKIVRFLLVRCTTPMVGWVAGT